MSSTVLIFVSSILISIISFFTIGYNGLFIKRTVVNIPFGLFEKSINKIKDEDNKFHFYFDIYSIENSVKDYLDRNISDRCDYYKFSLWPYRIDDYGNAFYNYDYNSIELFQLHFKATYNNNFKIETYATYSIMEIKNG